MSHQCTSRNNQHGFSLDPTFCIGHNSKGISVSPLILVETNIVAYLAKHLLRLFEIIFLLSISLFNLINMKKKLLGTLIALTLRAIFPQRPVNSIIIFMQVALTRSILKKTHTNSTLLKC